MSNINIATGHARDIFKALVLQIVRIKIIRRI